MRHRRQSVHRPDPTPREIQVGEMESRGLQHKEIAQALGTSYKTVQAQSLSLNRRLGVPTSAASVRRLIELGYIQIISGK